MGAKNRRFEDEKNSRGKSRSSIDNVQRIPPPPRSTQEKKEKPYMGAVLAIATCFGVINAIHVSSMFERYRHFSHLSNLEREMTFRTEMGLYYSYYKTIIEADSFLSGLNRLMYDNRTEYPDTVNVLQRFNLYPEVAMGGSYRAFVNVLSYLKLEVPQSCWQVSRGIDQAPVVSCEGLGDPIYWYLSGVWIAAGCTAALLFIHGSQLCGSLLGGFIAVSCFFFNHGEATRVQWTPPLRESFAFPFSIAMNIIVTHTLRTSKIFWAHPLMYGTLSLCYLLCWQFGQYTIALDVIILYLMYTILLIPSLPMLLVLLGAIYAFVNNLVFQFGNQFLLASPLAGVLIGVLLLYIFIEPIIQRLPTPTNIGTQIAFVFIAAIASKIELSRMLGVYDDSHITNVIKSKFTNYSDFHTLLYTCSPEFDFLPTETLIKLTSTLLIPCAAFVVGNYLTIFFKIIKNNIIKRTEESERRKIVTVFDGIDSGIVYNFILLGAYYGMAFLIMRLKLFFTPQLCVVASLFADLRCWRNITKLDVRTPIVFLLISLMAVSGLKNVRDQFQLVSEYNNPELEELISWVNTETGQDAVFAGPMPLMANLLLSTRRPIVNHPHYENAALRERTKSVYSIFSRKPPEEVYETLLSLKANYVVLEESWCFRRSKPGCGLVDIWDVEEPQYKHRPALCPKLFQKSPAPFHKVFSNNDYVVLQVPSKYIEIPAPKTRSS